MNLSPNIGIFQPQDDAESSNQSDFCRSLIGEIERKGTWFNKSFNDLTLSLAGLVMDTDLLQREADDIVQAYHHAHELARINAEKSLKSGEIATIFAEAAG